MSPRRRVRSRTWVHRGASKATGRGGSPRRSRNPAGLVAAIIARVGGLVARLVRASFGGMLEAFSQDWAAAAIATAVLLFAIVVPLVMRESDHHKAGSSALPFASRSHNGSGMI